jgi:hypothetical protein
LGKLGPRGPRLHEGECELRRETRDEKPLFCGLLVLPGQLDRVSDADAPSDEWRMGLFRL